MSDLLADGIRTRNPATQPVSQRSKATQRRKYLRCPLRLKCSSCDEYS
jgi:hypothetical protein